jgi:hypothetical protein
MTNINQNPPDFGEMDLPCFEFGTVHSMFKGFQL